MPLSLEDFPEFQELKQEVRRLQQQVHHLSARHGQWVTDEDACRITGLSRRTLLRERRKATSLIVWKDDHGIRYDYDSLLRHNERRAIGWGRLNRLLTNSV